MNDHTEQQLNCALHGPMITNPTGLWYTKNASGNYSTYAPACTCDYSDNEDENEDEDSAMSEDNQPETQDNYKMQVEEDEEDEDEDEDEDKVENNKKEWEQKHHEDFVTPSQKMHTQMHLDCALHGPMIKNPSGLWYSKNASGNYSMYAPSCTCDYSDDDDDDDL